MDRRATAVLVVLVVAAIVAVALVLRREPSSSAQRAEIQDTEFLSDSLGVALSLPPGRGWSFQREPAIPGNSYVTATHRSDAASVKLFATPSEQVQGLDDVERRRKDQLASLFGATDLAAVIDHVVREDRAEEAGYPTLRWQALSVPVDVAAEDQARVMFMWIATVRARFAYEVVGLLRFPAQPTPEATARVDSLLTDMAGIFQSLRMQ
jgi:hypothetical protein